MNGSAECPTSAVGHPFQVEQLWQLAAADRIPQSLLFAGPSGVGKRRIAFDLAAAILAGGSGRSIETELKLAWSGNHPDLHTLHRIEEKKEISVDQVREFCSSMRLKPYQGRTSVWIIDNAEEMNIAASNSLLMPLEEPPAHAKIILLSDSIHRIVPTIVSRCQPVFFGFLSAAEVHRIIAGLYGAADQKQDARLVADLARLAGTSLAALGLEPFLDPANGRVADAGGLTEHLQQIVAATRSVRSRIEGALRSGTPAAHLISVAAELAAEKEAAGLTWSVLRQMAHEKLSSGNPEQIPGWAAALQTAVRSEQLINERNLSPQIHLAELLLQFGDADSR